MEQIAEQREQISQYLRPYMEDCFQKSCNLIQTEIERHAIEIWARLRNCIYEYLKPADILQKQ